MENLVKTCNTCNEDKLMEEFHLHPNAKDYHSQICIICKRKYDKIYSQNNKIKDIYKSQIKNGKSINQVIHDYNNELLELYINK